MDMIQGVLDLWGLIVEKVYSLLTMDLRAFSVGTFDAMEAINIGLQGIGYAFLVIFTLMEVVKTCSSLREAQRPEFVLKVFIRMIVVKYIIGYGFALVNEVFKGIQGIIRHIFETSGTMAGGEWLNLQVPEELLETNFLLDIFNKIFKNMFNLVPSLLLVLMYLLMIIMGISLILTVFGRFFKLYMYMALSPIPLATFGCRETSSIGKSYIKSFVSAALEGAVIALAIVIFSQLMTHGIGLTWENEFILALFRWTGDVWANRLAYSFYMLFTMLIFMGVVKAADKFVHKLVGI